MKQLTYDRLKELLAYEPSTGIFTWLPQSGKGRWTVSPQAGTINSEGYRRIWIDGRAYPASRLAWFYMTGEWPEGQVDHHDVVPSNDVWNNLRVATQTQNKANSHAYKNNKLGIKGVRLHRNGRFEARLRVNRSLKYLGCFRTIEEAKAVYDAAAKLYFGEFARSA